MRNVTNSPIRSSAPHLIAKARGMVRIDADIDRMSAEALDRLLESLNSEAQLSAAGAHAMEQRLLRLLTNILLMQRDLRMHPEIDAEEIVKPIFLVGGARTGSTKLHKMLASGGDFHFLPFW